MEKKKVLLTGAAVAAMAAIGGHPVQAATSTLTIDAVIVEAIVLNCTGDLDFGDLDGTAGDTITITADGGGGTRAEGVGTDNLVGTGGAEGSCDVTGSDGLTVVIQIPHTTVDDVGAGAPMAVNNFNITGLANTAGASPTFTADLGTTAGAETFFIGGDLVVGAGQVAGTYTGTTTVDVSYQ